MIACVLKQEDYKPGDQAPDGYLAWHEWAEVQHKAGLRQKECGRCSKWVYPQQVSATTDKCVMQSRKGPVTRIFAASLGVQPEVRANRPVRPVVFCVASPMMMPIVSTKTLQLRIKDKHAKVLRQMAREVNQVWNHINEVSAKAARPFHGKPKFLSGYDLQKCTAGFSKCDDVKVGSGTVQLVCVEYATRRKQFKKTRLNWRVSNPESSKYSLGWIPFKGGHAKYKAGQIHFAGQKFSLWDSYGLSKYELRAGSFTEDSRGRWYFNVTIEIPELIGPRLPAPAVGIDLGLKDCATASNEQKLHGRWYREHELALAKAQRANKKKRARAIHAKIKNQRKDDMHQFSTTLVRENAAIFVGDVASAKLVKTKMAKSTLDAGWSSLKTMLEYKSHQAGIVFMEVNEAYTTQTCSCCGSIPASSPKGRAGLGIREWKCSDCGAVHNRDVNAARNILALGLKRLAGGIQGTIPKG